jgi:hypothetical protein
MSVTVHTPRLVWAQTHRALLVAVLFCLALVATAALLVSQAGGEAAPTTSTPVSDLQPVDDGCLSAGSGQAC